LDKNNEKLKELEEGIKVSILHLMEDSSNIEEGKLLRQRELERNCILRGTEERWRLRSRAI
jgi:hypothetical protein